MKVAVAYYRDLVRWDAKSFTIKQWQWTEDILKPIGDVLKRRAEPATNSELPMLSIHFGGRISERPVKELKGHLFTAYSQDIVFSKIDARNGAITVIPDQYPAVAFTSEFPIYSVREEVKALPAYLFLVFQTPTFLAQINALVSGASGRKRITPEWWESLTIPVPSITEQKSIIREYQTALQEAEKLQQEAEKQEQSINDYLLAELGVKKQVHTKRSGVFVVQFSSIERWDPYFFKNRIVYDESAAVRLSSTIQKKVSNKIMPNPTKTYRYVGLEHVAKDTGEYTCIETSEYPVKSQSLSLQKGCIYYSKLRPYLNKAFLFDSDSQDFIATGELYGLEPVADVEPKFLLYLLLSDLVQSQIKGLMIGARMPRISDADFENLKIVLPSKSKQKKVVAEIEGRRERASQLQASAVLQRRTARELTEKRILGIA